MSGEVRDILAGWPGLLPLHCCYHSVLETLKLHICTGRFLVMEETCLAMRSELWKIFRIFSYVILKINSLSFYLLNFVCHFFDVLFFLDKNTKDWLIKRNIILQMFYSSLQTSCCKYWYVFCQNCQSGWNKNTVG